MTTQALPTVVPFDKRHDSGKGVVLSGFPSGDPDRHRLSFSTGASVRCAGGFHLAGLPGAFVEPRWYWKGPRPNHAPEGTP